MSQTNLLHRSSNVEQVDYDPDTKHMHIKFRGTEERYKFTDIEQHEHDDFVTAQSPGKHFIKHIKPKGGVKVKT